MVIEYIVGRCVSECFLHASFIKNNVIIEHFVYYYMKLAWINIVYLFLHKLHKLDIVKKAK